MPARDWSLLARKLRDVIAGSGLRVSEWSESIMQFERFNARKAVSVATLSGTWLKRFDDKSKE